MPVRIAKQVHRPVLGHSLCADFVAHTVGALRLCMDRYVGIVGVMVAFCMVGACELCP